MVRRAGYVRGDAGERLPPHAAVFSSIIDVLWQTGIAWAQAKALQLFSSAVQCAPSQRLWSALCLSAG